MDFKILNRPAKGRVVPTWVLIVTASFIATGLHLSVHAADDDKQPVTESAKEQIVDDAKKKEEADKAEVGEASYNVQDCEPDSDGEETDKENMNDDKDKTDEDKDENAKGEDDSSESTDELDECAKMIK